MPTNDTFNVGLVQMSCSPDPDDNLRRACEKVRQAAKLGAGIVCLPELFRTQYFCQREDHVLFDLAEPVPGPTTEALSAAAKGGLIGGHHLAHSDPALARRQWLGKVFLSTAEEKTWSKGTSTADS